MLERNELLIIFSSHFHFVSVCYFMTNLTPSSTASTVMSISTVCALDLPLGGADASAAEKSAGSQEEEDV